MGSPIVLSLCSTNLGSTHLVSGSAPQRRLWEHPPPPPPPHLCSAHCSGSPCQVQVTPVFSCYSLGIPCACFHCWLLADCLLGS